MTRRRSRLNYRENQERLETLAMIQPAAPADYRRWNLQDTLARIDDAEKLWRQGHSGHGWEGLRLGVLEGRTPDEARIQAHARYGVVQ